MIKTYKLAQYKLEFDEAMTHETYECPCYHGIIFKFKNGDSFDALFNKHMGHRLIIKKANCFVDMPLKESSFAHLPAGVTLTVEA